MDKTAIIFSPNFIIWNFNQWKWNFLIREDGMRRVGGLGGANVPSFWPIETPVLPSCSGCSEENLENLDMEEADRLRDLQMSGCLVNRGQGAETLSHKH